MLVAMKKLPGSRLNPVNMTFVQDPLQGPPASRTPAICCSPAAATS
ncbi:hypothetical protein NKH18_02740 [Streptomyces sp. M10(2022)]